MKGALDSISEGFALFDADERFVLFNRKWLSLYPAIRGIPEVGMTFGEIIRRIAHRLSLEGSEEQAQSWANEWLRRFRDSPGPWQSQLPNGRWVRVNEYRTAEGGTVAIHADITELKEQERTVRKSEERLRAVVETAADAIIAVRENGGIESFNPAAERMFGYSLIEVIGRPFAMLLATSPPVDAAALQGWTRNPGHRSAPREFTARRRDGSPFSIELTLSRIELGDHREYTVFLRDTTTRKAQQEELVVAKDAAEAANIAKSRFFNTMSHELRTPLTALLGNLDYLRRYDDVPADEIREVVAEMHESGHHLLALINDLLDFSRIEAGKMNLSFEAVPVAPLVDSVLSTFHTPAANRGLGLTARFAARPVVRADPVRFKQILFNLVGNAIKFTERGEIAVIVDVCGPDARITVRDTGCGIPEAELDHIFETFRQVDSSSTRKAGGTGLGLAITKHLVERHDGVIGVESRLGDGSAFFFTLPLAAQAAGDAPPAAAPDGLTESPATAPPC